MTTYRYCPLCRLELVLETDQSGEAVPTCPEGHFRHYNSPSPASLGIVVHEGKCLLLQRAITPNKGKWDLPGGYIEPGESAEDALLRELKEETTLDITIRRYFRSFIVETEHNHIINFVFVCELASGEVRLSDENTDFRWHTLGDPLPDDMTHDREVIRAFQEQL